MYVDLASDRKRLRCLGLNNRACTCRGKHDRFDLWPGAAAGGCKAPDHGLDSAAGWIGYVVKATNLGAELTSSRVGAALEGLIAGPVEQSRQLGSSLAA